MIGQNTQTPFIVGGTRTPVGHYGGALSSVRPDDLAALVITETVQAAGVDPAAVDEVIIGNTNGAGEDNRNVARMAWLLAGFPETVPGFTVNRLCASGMTAIALASQMVALGQADIVVAGGVESMSRGPWVMRKPEKAFAKPSEIADTTIGWSFINPLHRKVEGRTFTMPETAEEVARRFGVTRERSDAFAEASHRKAIAAQESGALAREITEVHVTGSKGAVTVVDTDEGPRPGTSTEKLASLPPVVSGGSVVTAGNASSLNDGATAVIVASERAVNRLGLSPRARVVTFASSGVAPEIMGVGPVTATSRALDHAGWDRASLGAVELNEAFAPQALACIDQMGVDPEIVNNDGGAIALGHPLGSSGARITHTLMRRMQEGQIDRGLATMCVGFGQGTALLLARP